MLTGVIKFLRLTWASPAPEPISAAGAMTINPVDTLKIAPVSTLALTPDSCALYSLLSLSPNANSTNFDSNDLNSEILDEESTGNFEVARFRLGDGKATRTYGTQCFHPGTSEPSVTPLREAPSATLAPNAERQARNHRMYIFPDCEKWLTSYVTEDERRCAEHNVPSLWNVFLSQSVKYELSQLAKRHCDTFLKIWVGTCSAESVSALRRVIQKLREKGGCAWPSPQENLSAKSRLYVIEKAEQGIAELTLLRRCHVVRLWEDHGFNIPETRAWIACQPHDGVSKDTKKPGNPQNIKESLVTQSLLEQMFPTLEKDGPNYTRAYLKVKRLRKLGHRLSMLKELFGQGILGLLPFSEFEMRPPLSSVSDSM